MSRPERSGAARAVRILLLVVVAAAILVLLFTVVFPWVERNLSDPTLGGLGALVLPAGLRSVGR